MDFLTRFSIQLMNTIAVFCLLTIPHITLFLFDFGVKYSMGAIYFCSFVSIVVSPLITKWEINIINKNKKN